MKPLSPPARRALAWLGAGVLLALVFAAWTNPHLAVALADFVAACF